MPYEERFVFLGYVMNGCFLQDFISRECCSASNFDVKHLLPRKLIASVTPLTHLLYPVYVDETCFSCAGAKQG